MCAKDGEICEKLEITDFKFRNSFWDGSHLTELLLLQYSCESCPAQKATWAFPSFIL